ncbi:MAG: CARDB domain-containing protein [Anaerolineae bacterium]
MSRSHLIVRLLAIVLLGSLMAGSLMTPAAGSYAAAGDAAPPRPALQAAASPLPGICSESNRFGFGLRGWTIAGYDVDPLQAGWYHNFGTIPAPERPGGMAYVQTIRLSPDGPFADRACSTCPTWDQLEIMIDLNPGNWWMIGNEPDRQDLIPADRYAELYHAFYTFIKAHDPSSLIGTGGVVQPTPIRLQYLDLILDAYRSQNDGAPMPIDVWNIHNYVLREGEGWGGGIPPGTDPALAMDEDDEPPYDLTTHDNLELWTGHIVAMRAWMRDRGYRDRPLIITEFGILMPEIYLYDYDRVRTFMLATFDWLRTATDPETGYAPDGNRLVQAWAWYSLNDPAFEGWTSWNHLFDPTTKAITALGQDFAAYTAPLTQPYNGTVDVQIEALGLSLPEPEGGDPVTVTVTALVINTGASPAQNTLIRFERDGELAGEVTIPTLQPGAKHSVAVKWPDLALGAKHQVVVRADPEGILDDCNPYNNVRSAQLLVTHIRSYLPLIRR